MSKAIDDIAAERRRQIEIEGWTPEHDDTHNRGELSRAAACYVFAADDPDEEADDDGNARPPFGWPWDRTWWKPCEKRRMLVKAGALIAAEIERMDREIQG